MLVIILVEMFGYMGLMEVKLSALPAVTLVATVGIGLEFIMHLVLAFITTTGERCVLQVQSLLLVLARPQLYGDLMRRCLSG